MRTVWPIIEADVHALLAGVSLFEGMSLMSDPVGSSPHGLQPENAQKASPQGVREQDARTDSTDALEHSFLPPVLSPQGNGKASNAARYVP